MTSATSPEKAYKEEIAGSNESIPLVYISGGSFMRGSSLDERGRQADEGSSQEVTVGDFWMSSMEITWDQYQVFLYREKDLVLTPNKGDIQLPIDGVSGATMPYVNFNRPGYPVIDITQYAASIFCKWLTAKTGRFYRLPTEAEWEYACRAGSSDPYYFNVKEDKLDQYGWYLDNSKGSLQKGGLKLPNAFGLYDMHGNAAEWVIDKYETTEYRKGGDNPVVFPEEQLYPRVVRGGSFKDDAAKLRSAARDYSRADWKKQDPQFPKSLWWHTEALHVGFRIVRPKEVPSAEEMEKYWGQPIPEY